MVIIIYIEGDDFIKKYNYEIGKLGESITIEYLRNLNYIILDKNFQSFKEEIDIICCKNDILVFIEVKSRYFSDYGNPCHSVTYSKQKKIIKISNYYINKKNLYNFNVRYDVIEIFLSNFDNSFTINHIEDAFRLY